MLYEYDILHDFRTYYDNNAIEARTWPSAWTSIIGENSLEKVVDRNEDYDYFVHKKKFYKIKKTTN